MGTWEPSGVGGGWNSSRPALTPLRQSTSAPFAPPVDTGSLAVADRSGASLSADGVRARLQPPSQSLIAAFGAFTSHRQPVFTTSIAARPDAAAAFAGRAARITAALGGGALIQGTVRVNTQTTTVRSSSGPIGLDLASAHSTLASAALALDVTSPEAASTLRSTAGLGLNVVDAASTVTSTGEMNAAAKSLGSSSLTVGASTSRIEITGAYTGNATSLSFDITKAGKIGVVGASPEILKFEVRDQNGTVVASHNGAVAAGDVIGLAAIGLQVRITAGMLETGTATTAVSSSPATVDTAAAFDAAWGTAPLFESFGRVSAGSFTVNGVAITVNAGDSIDSVLARINASAAGVTGTVVNDRVVLASSNPSEGDITLGGDTSGFLQATKLAGAATTRGNLRDDRQVLSATTQFGSVTSGSFQVNGVSISVNKDTDSLETILSRINAAGAGVTAAYDAAADRVVLTTTGNSEDAITISGDTTGFVAAARLSAAATVRGNVRDDLQVFTKTTQFAGVADGTFQINGATIAIDADQDSLSTVVQKINAAGAGVTATFNAVTNRLELETTADSEGEIAVGADTTGFLSAAGLDGGNTALGSIADDVQRLADTAAFAGVTAGSFEVNGVTVAVDPGADSLRDVLARINAAGAGVTATYDAATDRVTFTPDAEGATLSLGSDTSGFLDAANVALGTRGTLVNADAAFDGSDGMDPLFDPGVVVQAGSFTVNGVTIDVAADDSVNGVLAKITASAAGVIAAFDAASQTVSLVSTDGDSTDPILLDSDTSGFLAAVKLDGTAYVSAGARTIQPFDDPLADLTEYSGVSSGVLTVNGQTIAVDPETTTLRGLVGALDALDGVQAMLDESTGRIQVSSTDPAAALQVSDTSGVLGTLGIASRTYNPTIGASTATQAQTGSTVVSNSRDVAAAVERAADELGAVLAQLASSRQDGGDRFGRELVAAAGDALETLREAGISGFTLAGEGGDLRLLVDRSALASSLDALADSSSASRAVSAALGTFTERLAAAAAEPEPAPVEPDRAQVLNVTRAQLLAQHAAAAVSFLETLERAVNGAAEAEERADRPSDGVLDLETRQRIKAQVEEGLQASSDPLLGGLFDSLLVNAK